MVHNEQIEVSTIKTVLRILRYDEMQAKALCLSVAKAAIEDRKLSPEAAEEILEFVNGMSRITQ